MAISDNEKRLLQEFVKQLNDKLVRAIPQIRKEVANECDLRIRNSPEYDSLLYGSLKTELGVDSAPQRLNDILNIWLESIRVQLSPFKVVGTRIEGGLQITGMDTTDFQQSKHSSPANITLKDGSVWPWLEVLVLGSQPIYGYYYTLPNRHEAEYSRAGGFQRKKIGASWQLSGEYSGVEKDNFVTRSLKRIETRLAEIIQGAIDV